jgi:spore maturation protein CgeB
MKIRLFYHSLVSDWNHGNAHFLRGIATELIERGHDVIVYEPVDGWSLQNLRAKHGDEPIKRFHAAYPLLRSVSYDLSRFDANEVLADADLVIVHEWNDPELVRRIGNARRRGSFVALFHDTHHRLVTAPETMCSYDLTHYDGVLAYGRILRNLYLSLGLTKKAWVWHEAADTRRFRPLEAKRHEGDLVWIGNWGDEERAEELNEFLIEPVKALGLKARVYGVRYPDHARTALAKAGIEYAGWLPNFDVPEVFSRFKVTLHVPRRPYVKALPGIPTIRPFEALSCGLAMVCSPWQDAEDLFTANDFSRARTGREMTEQLELLLGCSTRRQGQVRSGLKTIRARHTCAHRTDELLEIFSAIAPSKYVRKPRPRTTEVSLPAMASPVFSSL